jgi:GNAT superfamily N-acetyltransferase
MIDMLDILNNFFEFKSFFSEWLSGIIGALFAGTVLIISKEIRRFYLNKKYPIKGDFITYYEDVSGGQKCTLSAPATIRQKGLDINGETTLEFGKTWTLEGKIGDKYVYGVYHAEAPFDAGIGNFFLGINSPDDLDGIWSGYDHENNIITSGRYWFKRIPKIQIQSITESYYGNVLELSSRLLGKGYLPNIPRLDKNKTVLLVALSSKTFIGFAYARITEKNNLNGILKNRTIDIPPDIKLADERGTLGLLKTVCVEPDSQGRGVATILIKECLNNLVTLGAETLISIAWKSSAGVQIGGVLSKLGFREWITLDKFWAEESISQNFSCPVCGNPPCSCSAVIYICSDFDKERKKPFK